MEWKVSDRVCFYINFIRFKIKLINGIYEYVILINRIFDSKFLLNIVCVILFYEEI